KCVLLFLTEKTRKSASTPKTSLNLRLNIADLEGTLASEPFTRSRRARGEVDPTFDLLQRHNFSVTPA
ncbi:hypothetical protein KI387_018451, partial [Taxus chinensis]